MSRVTTAIVEPSEEGMRLDRWFKAHYPSLAFGALQKLLRTGQIRLDGSRVKASDRIAAGQTVRVPPLASDAAGTAKAQPRPSAADSAFIRSLVIHRDATVIALDKPAGLAVQGGTRTERHLDAMLDALAFEAAERPRLVHRLDRDTSGVLLLARTRRAATALGKSFKSRAATKIYWAIVRGLPIPRQGTIDAPLRKVGHQGDQRVVAAGLRDAEAQKAVTDFRVLANAGKRAAWVALSPRTGRTHQLRAHMAAIGHPILGDAKYGGEDAFISDDLPRRLHLHARAIALPHPDGGVLTVVAELSPHMAESFRYLGFDAADAPDPFAGFPK